MDITIEIAGNRLHFTQAQVEHDENSDPVHLLFWKDEPLAREQIKPRLDGK